MAQVAGCGQPLGHSLLYRSTEFCKGPEGFVPLPMSSYVHSLPLHPVVFTNMDVLTFNRKNRRAIFLLLS